ncbi:MAG: dihydroorotase [Bacteroidetes bacterium]|nr:dihydroorotase [Bacteroidota bacterium]
MNQAPGMLIRNAIVSDPESEFFNRQVDIHISNGQFSRIGEKLTVQEGDLEFNAESAFIIPGIFDFQVNCGEPGEEENETFESLAAAALNGGVTGALIMPSAHPATDNRGQIEYKQKIASAFAPGFCFAGYISRKGEGKTLTELRDMYLGGALAFTDNKLPADHSLMLHLSMQYNGISGGLLMFHPEDSGLRMGGVMHESEVSVQLGMKGTPSLAEETAVNKLIGLARYHGHPIHIAGISCEGSVIQIAEAKAAGIPVTCSTYVHHLIFCDEDLNGFDSVYKVWPPLRGKTDRDALVKGVMSGTIDVVSSDHSPFTIEKKDVEFAYASYGMAGIETLLQAGLTALGKEQISTLVRVMSQKPRELLGLKKRTVSMGETADFVLIDPSTECKINRNSLKSLGINNPFEGHTLKGKILGTYTKSSWFQRSE